MILMEQSFFLLNQTSTTQGGYRFDHQMLTKDGIVPIKKEAFKLLEAFVYLVTGNSSKNYFASWSSCIKECMEKNHWSQRKF